MSDENRREPCEICGRQPSIDCDICGDGAIARSETVRDLMRRALGATRISAGKKKGNQ